MTVFAGFGLQGVVDQKSRDPESLSRSFAKSLKAIHNVKSRRPATRCWWSARNTNGLSTTPAGARRDFIRSFTGCAKSPATSWWPAPGGIAEGGPPSLAGNIVNKFRPGGLLIVRAGGGAGMFSGIIGGWSAGGPRGSFR